MFRKKSSGSSKSVSPVPPEFFDEDDQIFVESEDQPPPIRDINVNVQVVNDDADPHPSDLSGDTAENPSIQYEYTRKHPLGQILIAMFTENTKLAEKCNMKNMTISIDDLCRNFYNFQLLDKQKIKNNILQTTSNLENSIIARTILSNRSTCYSRRFYTHARKALTV